MAYIRRRAHSAIRICRGIVGNEIIRGPELIPAERHLERHSAYLVAEYHRAICELRIRCDGENLGWIDVESVGVRLPVEGLDRDPGDGVGQEAKSGQIKPDIIGGNGCIDRLTLGGKRRNGQGQ